MNSDLLKFKKIIILGGSGSGKSTLASKISLYTGYPIYHLDSFLHDSNWLKKDKDKWEEIQGKLLVEEVGIIDGNYTSILPNRIKWADLIIFIDMPVCVLLYRNFLRFIKIELGLENKIGTPNEARNIIRFSHLLWVLNWSKNSKKKVFSMIESIKDKKVIITNNPKELDMDKLLKI